MMQRRTIGGQEVLITEGGNILHTIRELFRAAGLIYHFPMNSPGVGINEDIVWAAKREGRQIIIQFEKQAGRYIISPDEVIEICDHFHSLRNEKGKNLFIIPVRSLKPLGGSS